MKRTKFSLLSLIAAGFIALACHASPAAAYDINCTTSHPGTTWPNGAVDYCGSTTELTQLATDAGNIWTMLNSIGGKAQSALTAGAAHITVFKNISDAKLYYTERGITPEAFSDVPAQTFYNAGFVPRDSFTFEQVAGQANPQIVLSTAHEVGHWADAYLGAQLSPKITGAISASTLWGQLVTDDFSGAHLRLNQFNSTAGGVTTTYNRPCMYMGGNGVFTHRSGKNGTMICNGKDGTNGAKSDGYGTALNTGYSGTNQNVLAVNAWSAIYGSNREIWAEEFAVYVANINDGYNNSGSLDTYFPGTLATQQFYCTATYIKAMNQLGTEPTSDLTSGGCHS